MKHGVQKWNLMNILKTVRSYHLEIWNLYAQIVTMELAGITPPSMRWDDTNLPEQWEKFMRHTALMFSGPLKAKTEEEKVSYLLLWVGDKGRDIRHTWSDISADDAKKLDTFYERFKKHVRPTLNPVFARYQSNNEIQGSEAIDSFVTRLRLKSRDCDYHDSDEMIRDRIVFGTNSPKIREKLINIGRDLMLQKAIQIGQNYEYAQEQMKQMTPNDVHMVKPKTKSRVHTDLAKQNSLTFPWLFPDTNLNFPDITVLAEKLDFIQTFVYSYSLQLFFFNFEWLLSIWNFAKFLFKLFSICI